MQRKKEINGRDGSAREFDLCISEFQGQIRAAFSRSYALIQVFCFCSTNFTWFNSIIKYKNLSTNKYDIFFVPNKTFYRKKMATHPYLLHSTYILKLKYFEGEPVWPWTFPSHSLFNMTLPHRGWNRVWKFDPCANLTQLD